VQAGAQQLQSLESLPMEERFVAIAQATGLIDFFAARGLSADQARTCLADSAKIEAISERSAKQTEELGINSTPSFLLNGQNIGNQSWSSLEPMLQRAGARCSADLRALSSLLSCAWNPASPVLSAPMAAANPICLRQSAGSWAKTRPNPCDRAGWKMSSSRVPKRALRAISPKWFCRPRMATVKS